MKETQKLFHKNFLLVVIGQIISLFGNAIVRFALPLYLLKVTNSPALFGAASACSFIPMIILTPIGGMIADRNNKRNIMVILDFSTAALLLIFSLVSGTASLVPLLIVTLMILYGIQGVYQPAVQASIPLLAAGENLLPANAIINQVSALSGLLGPVIGGLLYGFWGINSILTVSIVCFFLSAVMELFIQIPFQRQKKELSILKLIRHDFRESISFIRKDRPVIGKAIIVVALFNLLLSSLLVIAMPVLITQLLGLSEKLYGYAQGALAAGGLLGGILAGAFSRKLKIQDCHLMLLMSALGLLPISLSLYLGLPAMASYLIITVCCFLVMVFATLFSVQALTFVQTETPPHLIGKVISWVLALSMCAQPVGQAVYGGLFEKFSSAAWILILGGALSSALVAYLSKKVFSEM